MLYYLDCHILISIAPGVLAGFAVVTVSRLLPLSKLKHSPPHNGESSIPRKSDYFAEKWDASISNVANLAAYILMTLCFAFVFVGRGDGLLMSIGALLGAFMALIIEKYSRKRVFTVKRKLFFDIFTEDFHRDEEVPLSQY
jgi:hypothetical protein